MSITTRLDYSHIGRSHFSYYLISTINPVNIHIHKEKMFTLWTLIEASMLMLNAVCILHEERFLAKSKSNFSPQYARQLNVCSTIGRCLVWFLCSGLGRQQSGPGIRWATIDQNATPQLVQKHSYSSERYTYRCVDRPYKTEIQMQLLMFVDIYFMFIHSSTDIHEYRGNTFQVDTRMNYT